MRISEYETTTPYELSVFAEVYAEQKRIKYEDLISLAWHIEAFARTKRLPKLANILKKVNKKQQEQTPGEMYNILKSLTSMYGGKMYGRKG